jgi:pimeloyl-ACP methyl ester carboxylesterase
MTMTQHEAPATGRRYEAGGRELMLWRAGQGGPAVVFLPGASAVGLDYLNLHDRISAFTTSVLYDRGGTGWSDRAPLPSTGAAVAAELRELLRAAGVPGPYLLVGHSLGGGYARRFGQLFGDEVAGVLYIDSFYEETDCYLPERLHLARLPQPEPGPVQLALLRPFARRMYRGMLAGWPAPVRAELMRGHLSRAWWDAGVAERGSLVALADELKAGGPVPDRPVIVLTADGIDPGLRLMMSGRALREMTEGNRRLYAALAGSVSRGEVRPLAGARHSTVTTDRPDEVVQAIRDLIGRI